ncbi:MAG: FeoA family protein, partial [Cyclobacteriaceae bacterium]
DKHGKIPQRITKSLSAVNKGEKCIVLAVSDTSKDFLNYLEDLDISIKTEIFVIDKIAFDQSIKIKIRQEQFSLSRKVADNLLVGDKFN